MTKNYFKVLICTIALFLTGKGTAQTVTLLSEDFSTNTFATNGWNFPNGQPYWSINTFYTPTAGIAPNGLFFPPTTPTVANYNIPMASGTINASAVTGVVYFSCAIRLQGFNTSATGTEYMDVEYKSTSSATWSPIATFTNNLTGHNQNYAITNFILNGMAGQNFQVRFVARGANTYNIAGWGLDNIVITGVNCPASLPSITLSASSTSVCAGSSVTLVSAGGGPTFTWSPISSNSSSAVVNPTITTSYALLSSFPGCTTTPVTAVTTITVYSNPSTLSVSGSTTTICSGSSVTLTASGSGTYTWSPSTAASSIVVSPTVSTVYTVTSTNSISCKNAGTVSVIVNPSPVLGVFSSTSMVCLGNTANLVANGASTYSWSTGNSGAIIAVTPTVNTVYTVTGTSTAGCSSSGTTVVNVSPPINLSTSATLVCSGSQVTLSASGANTYTWSNAGSGASISVSPTLNTTYSVQGTDNVGCVSSRSLQLTVDITPTVSITNNTPAVCKGASIILTALGATNYTWSNATYSNITTVSPTLNTTYSVTGSSQAGCIGAASIATVTVLVKPNPTLTVSGPLSPVCSGKTAILSASGASTYSWSSGGNLANESITALTTAVYSVTGTNSVQCSSQNTVLVAVIPSPTLQISPSATALCVGASATVLASGANVYTWSTGSTVNVIYVTPGSNTTYTVSGINSNNCSDTKTIELVVNPYPVVSVSSNGTLICAGEPAILNASGANSYLWNGVSGSSTYTVFPSTTSVYTLQGISNACASEIIITQYVDECLGLRERPGVYYGYKVYPNPSQNMVNIELSDNSVTKLHVIDMSGRVIFKADVNTKTYSLDLSNYEVGIYYLKLEYLKQQSTLKLVRN